MLSTLPPLGLMEKESEVMPTQTRRLHKPTSSDGSREIPPKMRPDHVSIARLAYLHWMERGCPIGSPEEDWSRAEPDLKNEQARTA